MLLRRPDGRASCGRGTSSSPSWRRPSWRGPWWPSSCGRWTWCPPWPRPSWRRGAGPRGTRREPGERPCGEAWPGWRRPAALRLALHGALDGLLHLAHGGLDALGHLLARRHREGPEVLDALLHLGLLGGVLHLHHQPLRLGLELLAGALELLTGALEEDHQLLVPFLGHRLFSLTDSASRLESSLAGYSARPSGECRPPHQTAPPSGAQSNLHPWRDG